jgi:Ca2+-binding RTX toxin-like protein
MIAILLCIALGMLSILTLSHVDVFGIQSNSTDLLTDNFDQDLKSKIDNLVSNALNETGNILNSSLITNQSNLTSNNIIISNNKVISTVNSNGSGSSSSSIIKDQAKTINGVCTSIKVGGNGNDTLYSSGSCNDELTGGVGADKFTCGEGLDTVKDYNPKEGDIILDKQNCEKIL